MQRHEEELNEELSNYEYQTRIAGDISSFRYPHLSLLCIASHIKDKFDDLDIDIVDGHHESYDEICEIIKNNNYDVIGFSIDFTNYIHQLN